MKLKITIKQLFFILIIAVFSSQNTFSQCFQIESILADACDGGTNTEGQNEMVRFRVGSTPINTSTLVVNWPNNPWNGLVQNATTLANVNALNADIIDAGGCKQLIQPTGGVLPANAAVIIVTGFAINVSSNSFGALTEDTYIIFQNSSTGNNGHFANYNSSPGLRTLTMSFGSCSDTVTYERSSLIGTDGATVLFSPSGTPTYINYGCAAPVPPFTVDAGTTSPSACAGITISLNGTSLGYQSVHWSAASGIFSNPNGLSTNYTISPTSTGTITLTLTATNSCTLEITDTVTINVTNSITPTFNIPTTICGTPPALPTTSLNGITGVWTPSVITTSGTYNFVPNTGQCAIPYPLTVTITSSITPTFNIPATICSTAIPPALPTTSLNGITGIWTPSVITTSGTYNFAPNTGQCATPYPLTVTITSSITPTFNIPTTICSTATPPVLPTTSLNGITGTWTPSVITTSGTYNFAPNTGQCATGYPLTVTVTSSITPTFNIPTTICSTATPPVLPATSLNGIIGTWTPSAITTSGTYNFSPNTGQCATGYPLTLTVTSSITPTFNIPTTICSTATPPVLPTTSLNGITGTWTPSVITTSGTYNFAPNTGQCATGYPLTVTVTNSITPTFNIPTTICSTATPPVLPTTSLNGITGTWTPSAITTSGTYNFAPNTGQCATSYPLTVTLTSSITPTFNIPTTICGTPPALPTTSLNGIIGTWTPSAITTSGTYNFAPNTGQCATSYPLTVTVTNSITPTFNIPTTICSTATPPSLPATSLNGITGTWTPSVITTSGTYNFAPSAGQCATSYPLTVTVTSSITPTFNIPTTICNTATPPALPTTSLNGITGTWTPSAITTSGTYNFVPNAGQCATSYPLTVTLTSSITPTFNIPTTICGTPPALPTTSLNGITGTWTPSAITTSGTYNFAPNTGQCATSYPLTVTVTSSITPTFNIPTTICSTATPPALPTTSLNGITGTWTPSVITTSGTYNFAPNTGQCATAYPLTMTITKVDFEINEGCVDNNYMLQIASNSFDLNDADYKWTNIQGNTIGTNDSYLNVSELLKNTSVTEEFPITYQVTVTNKEGCSETKSKIVYGVFCGIPKGISPNNDTKNDYFDLSGLGVKDITIFNRYGTEVYSCKNYTKQWNGVSNGGKELPDATYFYVITKSNGENVTGWVYINR